MLEKIKNKLFETKILLRSIPSLYVTMFCVSIIAMNLLANKSINLPVNWLALDAGIFVHNSVKILEDGTKVKSVGKDISDSLGGAIYNAILSVDVNELDYLENITIAETGIATLNSYETVADRLFGFNRDARGNLIQVDNKTDENEDELISNAINQEIKNNQKVLDQIKQSNKNTKLSDQQLLDMYNTMTGNGFVIF